MENDQCCIHLTKHFSYLNALQFQHVWITECTIILSCSPTMVVRYASNCSPAGTVNRIFIRCDIFQEIKTEVHNLMEQKAATIKYTRQGKGKALLCVPPLPFRVSP